MPYRAELKRPDLKGQFPCSVCGKIFCHSSSLSRHRMQAHFKSYTCTQCNQEIASNETLRSHMFRMHGISRMFMCRCCNWAFPDKTSLHIHMQSMLRNGTPGEVAVLARSTTEDGPHEKVGPFEAFNNQLLNNNANAAKNFNNVKVGSIFPTLLKQDNLMQYLRKDGALGGIDMSAIPPNQWLTSWLTNNPLDLSPANANNTISVIRQATSSKATEDESPLDDDDLEALEIETNEDDLHEVESSHSPRSMNSDCDIYAKSSSTDPSKLVAKDLRVVVDEKMMTTEQLSPTVSDSHTSGTSSHHGDSPVKCFDCQVVKSRLTMSEGKLREYEEKISLLEAKIAELSSQQQRDQERMMSVVSAQIHPVFPLPAPLPLMQNPAMKLLIQNFMQSTLNRQSC